MLILCRCARRLAAVGQQCKVSSVLHHTNAALRNVEAAQRALENSRKANDARQAAFTAQPLTPRSINDCVATKGEVMNPYDPMHSASPTGEKSSADKPQLDPVQTADTLPDNPRMEPERAHPQAPPQRVTPNPNAVFPMPIAKPVTGVPEYKGPADYMEHDTGTPVYDPEGDNNV
jgi:hypothetical protein